MQSHFEPIIHIVVAMVTNDAHGWSIFKKWKNCLFSTEITEKSHIQSGYPTCSGRKICPPSTNFKNKKFGQMIFSYSKKVMKRSCHSKFKMSKVAKIEHKKHSSGFSITYIFLNLHKKDTFLDCHNMVTSLSFKVMFKVKRSRSYFVKSHENDTKC